VVYAIGDIVDGAGDGVLGAREHIASHTLVAALGALAADATVKAVVLRIDSGGGSAQASELIWRAVAALKAQKPVIVSMSDVAASGGYYIASGATKIFALEDTLTARSAWSAASSRAGRARQARGQRVPDGPRQARHDDDELRAVDRRRARRDPGRDGGRVPGVRRPGRRRPSQDARRDPRDRAGRVWTGSKAKELGLVDAIGGLDAALAEARTLGKVDAAAALEVYPSSITLRDLIAGYGDIHAPSASPPSP